MIIESLDAQRKKTMVNATHRISILKEISMYTTGEEDSVALGDIMASIREKFGDATPKAESNAELEQFMATVLPNYDRTRVYHSDIKKLLRWYNVLAQNAPEVFEGNDEEETAAAE
jgi:hypothetical protein